MKQNILIGHGQHILDLAGRWRTETLNQQEYQELNAWFFALEGKELGAPVEITVDIVEKRLHEQLFKNKKNNDQEEGPPHPWH